MYRGWRQTDYQNKHYNINQKDEGTYEDRGRDGGTNFIWSTKEQETRLTLQEHDDDDDVEKRIVHKVCHLQELY
jgi:predicted SprT family Zn-dependent metalloprotease